MSHSYFESQPSFPQLSQLPELSPNKQISAEYFLKLGNRHYHHYLARALKKDLEAAITHYKQALEINPSVPEAYVKLAAALWDQGAIQLEMAIHYCQTALHLNPAYGEGHLFLGYFLRRAGRLDEAESQFRLALSKAGEGGERGSCAAKARMALGRVLIQQAAFSYELAPLRRVVITAAGLREFLSGCCLLPTDAMTFQVFQGALVADAQIFGLTGTGRILKTLGLRKQTASLYEWATRQLPQEPIFFHLLGDLHAEMSNLDGAIYFYNRAQELDPDNISLYKKLGRAYNHCKDTRNAAISLEKVVEAEAHDFDTMYLLAQIYTDRHEYMRALYYFKELLKGAAGNPYLHSNMAYVLFKLEDYDGAILEYQSAVNFGEDAIWTATVAQTLGTIYYQIKQDLEAAISMFQLAYRLDPGNLDALTMLGDIYTEQGNFEAAIQAYRHILREEPDNADCYNYLGYLLWQLDKNDEAVVAYEKAIALNLDNPVAYNNLGVIFLDEKCQLQRALEMFETACELKPDYTLAHFNVGRAREAMGQTAEAARLYTAALSLNATNPELSDDEILERLENLFQV